MAPLPFDDPRWPLFRAGYRTPVDLRPLLTALELASDPTAAWDELWEELHHQGDIELGSLVAVPHLVRIHAARGKPDWNTYALVTRIALVQRRRGPPIPKWLRDDFRAALEYLGTLGIRELAATVEPALVRGVLAFLAFLKGARTYARLLIEFDESEVRELMVKAFGDGVSLE